MAQTNIRDLPDVLLDRINATGKCAHIDLQPASHGNCPANHLPVDLRNTQISLNRQIRTMCCRPEQQWHSLQRAYQIKDLEAFVAIVQSYAHQENTPAALQSILQLAIGHQSDSMRIVLKKMLSQTAQPLVTQAMFAAIFNPLTHAEQNRVLEMLVPIARSAFPYVANVSLATYTRFKVIIANTIGQFVRRAHNPEQRSQRAKMVIKMLRQYPNDYELKFNCLSALSSLYRDFTSESARENLTQICGQIRDNVATAPADLPSLIKVLASCNELLSPTEGVFANHEHRQMCITILHILAHPIHIADHSEPYPFWPNRFSKIGSPVLSLMIATQRMDLLQMSTERKFVFMRRIHFMNAESASFRDILVRLNGAPYNYPLLSEDSHERYALFEQIVAMNNKSAFSGEEGGPLIASIDNPRVLVMHMMAKIYCFGTQQGVHLNITGPNIAGQSHNWTVPAQERRDKFWIELMRVLRKKFDEPLSFFKDVVPLIHREKFNRRAHGIDIDVQSHYEFLFAIRQQPKGGKRKQSHKSSFGQNEL